MRKSTIRNFALAASALTSLLAVPAFAQSADDGNGTDIIVTARRTEEKLQDVPISITVYNQEQLTSRNITNSSELATYTPSLTLNSRYGPEKSSFAIRGFQQDLNTAFPIDRLRELVADGTVGSMATVHYSFMGAFPPAAAEPHARHLAGLLKADKIDAVLLIPV